MLDETSKEKLEKAGFNVESLETAVKSEEETAVEVPKFFTKEDVDTAVNNKLETKETSIREILAKDIKKTFGIESDTKDFGEVLGLAKETKVEKTDNTEQLTTLQDKIKSLTEEKEQLIAGYEAKDFTSKLDNSLLASVPKNTKLPAQDIVDLYKLRNTIVSENGEAFVKGANGEIIQDDVFNNVKAVDHFKTFLDKNGYVAKKGMGGKDDTKAGKSGKKFESAKDFQAYCKAQGKDPMSAEMQKYYRENR